jgi:hypothetical protein
MAKKDYTVKIKSTCPVSLTFSDGDVGRYDIKLKMLAMEYIHIARLMQNLADPYDRLALHMKQVDANSKISASSITVKQTGVYFGQARPISMREPAVFRMIVDRAERFFGDAMRLLKAIHDKYQEQYLLSLHSYVRQLSENLDRDLWDVMREFEGIYRRTLTKLNATRAFGYQGALNHSIAFDQEFHSQALESKFVINALGSSRKYYDIGKNIVKLTNICMARRIDLMQQMQGKIQA